jgi:predicted nucleotidyltransferase
MLMELREILRRDVDLKTPGFLSDRIRADVMRGAKVLYAA